MHGPIMDTPQRNRPDKDSAHQRFVARVEQYRKRERDLWGPEEYGPVLDRLCANDVRMRGFWALTDGLSNKDFDSLMGLVKYLAGSSIEELDGLKESKSHLDHCAASLPVISDLHKI